jgi:hypothetical protein
MYAPVSVQVDNEVTFCFRTDRPQRGLSTPVDPSKDFGLASKPRRAREKCKG